MELFKIILISIITIFLTVLIKEIKPELSLYIYLAGAILILISIINGLKNLIEEFKNLFLALNIDSSIFKVLFKIIAVGYLTEFSASLCKDMQNSLLAEKIILAGKILIFGISIPIFKNIIEIIVGLL